MNADFPAALDCFADRCRRLAPAMAGRAAVAILDEAVARTPVATGRLRDGWRIEPGGDGSVRVVNDVPYAASVEYGSRARPARPMARPAVLQVSARVADLDGAEP